MPLPDSERCCIFLPRRHRFMSGTERMKNNIFRRFFSYCKNGATFDFRGRSIFFDFLLIAYFRIFPYDSLFDSRLYGYTLVLKREKLYFYSWTKAFIRVEEHALFRCFFYRRKNMIQQEDFSLHA